RHHHDVIAPGGLDHLHQLVVAVEIDGLEAAADRRVELRDARLFHDAVPRREEQVGTVLVRAGVDDRLNLLSLVQRDEVDEGSTSGGALLHRNLMSAQAVYPAPVREEQQVRVGGRGEQVGHVVVVTQVAALHAAAAPALAPEGVGGDGLDVTLLRENDDDLFVLDQIQGVELAGVDGDPGPTLSAVAIAYLSELVLDHRAQLLLAAEDRLELLNAVPQLAHLVPQFLTLQLRQPPELHIEDEVGL